MVRVFTVNFRFKSNLCSALVHLKEDQYDLNYHVRFLDKEIAELIPYGKLNLSLAKGIDNPTVLSNPLVFELVQITSEAISTFMRKEPLSQVL